MIIISIPEAGFSSFSTISFLATLFPFSILLPPQCFHYAACVLLHRALCQAARKANTSPRTVDPIRQRIVCYHAASVRLMLALAIDTSISFGFSFNSGFGFGFDIRMNFGFNFSFRFDFGFIKTQLTRPLFPQQKRLLFSDIILISLLYHSFIACQAFSKKQICPTRRNVPQNAAIRQIKSDKSAFNLTLRPSLIELAVPVYSLSSKIAESIRPFNNTPSAVCLTEITSVCTTFPTGLIFSATKTIIKLGKS